MKYEIIKGSEKDFDGAPEWATMKCYCSLENPPVIVDRNLAFTDGGNEGCFWQQVIDHTLTGTISDEAQWFIIAERRPITEPVVNQQLTTEWDGEGLPPVGVRCEHLGGGENDWMIVTVIAISERPDSSFTDYWLRTDRGANFIIGNPYRFRPIRSPEDVARSNAIGKMERAYEDLTGNPAREAEEYYDLIAAGKIPGVTKTPTVSELMRVTENATREDCEAIVKMLSGK